MQQAPLRHGMMICYYCLSDINQGNRVIQPIEKCPICKRSLSFELLNIFSLYHDGLLYDASQRLPESEDERVKVLGEFYRRGHGWAPYGEFIIAAVVSGVVGNLAYDIIKIITRKLFERNYPKTYGINVDEEVEFMAQFIQRSADLNTNIKVTLEIMQQRSTKMHGFIVEEDKVRELIEEIRKGLMEEIIPIALRSTAPDSDDYKLLCSLLDIQEKS